MNSTKDADRTITDLIVRGAMDKEAESSRLIIRKLIESKGDVDLFFGKHQDVKIFFKGFFSGILMVRTIDRLTSLLKCDSELLQAKLSSIADVMWDDLLGLMGTRMNDYYEELERIAAVKQLVS